MENGQPSKEIENWYTPDQWKSKFNDLEYAKYLPFTKVNLKNWLEEYRDFLAQADSSVICMRD